MCSFCSIITLGYMLIGNDVKLNSPSSLIGQALAEILQYPDRARDALRVLLHLVRFQHRLYKNLTTSLHRNTLMHCCYYPFRWRSLFRGYRTVNVIPCIHPSRVWRTRSEVSPAGRPCWQLWASVLTLQAPVFLLQFSFPLLTQETGSSSAAPRYNHYWVCRAGDHRSDRFRFCNDSWVVFLLCFVSLVKIQVAKRWTSNMFENSTALKQIQLLWAHLHFFSRFIDLFSLMNIY